MRFFFRSKQFKIIVAVFLSIVILTIISAFFGAKMSPQSNIAGTIVAPFQKLVTDIKNGITDFNKAYSDGNALLIENSELKSQLNELREQIAEYDTAIQENEFYKNYLGIKDKNPDFTFCPATLISRDGDDPYGSFVINRGSNSGISLHNPVITDEGLVGYISEVGHTTCKVETLLSPNVTIGALDNRTSDSGIISGNLELSKNGLCRFYNLARSCNVAVGDYVMTSGEGIFPDGILIGSIEEIGSDKYNTSIYANIKPFVAIDKIRDVMVITEFEGRISTSKEVEK